MSETYVLTREQLETVLRSTYAAGEHAGECPLSAARAERRFRRAIDAEVARAAEYTARTNDRRNNPRRCGRHQKVRRMMSETRRIKAPDGWTLLVRNSGSIEAQIADVWVWLDEGGGLAVESDEANHGLCIPAEVVRAVLNQTMPLPAELIDGEWECGGSEGEPDASVTYTEEPYPETGHVGWCWWAHGKMGDAESLVGAMGAAEAALKAEAPGG